MLLPFTQFSCNGNTHVKCLDHVSTCFLSTFISMEMSSLILPFYQWGLCFLILMLVWSFSHPVSSFSLKPFQQWTIFFLILFISKTVFTLPWLSIFFSLFFNTCLSCYLLIYFGKCDYSLFQQLNVKCTSFANQCHARLKIRN